MPRPKKRDLRKRFQSLYRFIETELTEDNWLGITIDAARLLREWTRPGIMVSKAEGAKKRWPNKPRSYTRVINSQDIVDPRRGVEFDIDLDEARALQAKFRQELDAIARKDSSTHTTLSHILERRFDRLRRILTIPPWYAQERVHKRGIRTLTMSGPVYREKVKRKCPSCGRTYSAPPGTRRTSCGERACVIEQNNELRKKLREASRPRLRRNVPNKYSRS